MRVVGEPPVYPKDRKDRNAIKLYITALKRWSRVGGCPKKEQGDAIIYHASQKSPEYYEELETKFGDDLAEKEDGVDRIVQWLEERTGVSRHSEVVRLVTVFYKCSRNKGEDLVDFVTRFEKAYKDVQNLTLEGIDPILSLSSTGKAIILLTAANLPDVDYQIVTKGLKFDETDKNKEKKTYEETKTAIINHQVAKQSNHQIQLQPQTASAAPKSLQTFLSAIEQDQDLQAVVETYYAGKFNKQNTNKGQRGEKRQARKWKCDYCICDHPKWQDCECACTKHKKENCPNPDPVKKKKADEREKERKKRREENSEGPAYLTYEYQDYVKNVVDTASTSMTFLVVGETEEDIFPRSLDQFQRLIENGEEQVQGVIDRQSSTDWNNPTVLQDSDCVASPPGMVEGVSDLQLRSPRSGGEWSHTMLTKVMVPTKVVLDPQGGQANETAQRVNQSEGDAKLEVTQLDPMRVLKLGDALLSLTPGEVVPDFLTNCGQISQIESQDCQDQKVYFQGQDLLNQKGDTSQFTMIVDSASPGTIVGQNIFKQLRDTYPAVIRKTFKVEKSAKNYQFGGGERTHSIARVRVPLYIMDTNDNAQLVHIWVEVLEQPDVPFLLGGASLERAGAVVDLGGQQTLTLKWNDQTAKFPLYKSKSGHFHVMILALSQDDEKQVINKVLDELDWTDEEVRQAVNIAVNIKDKDAMAELLDKRTGDIKTYIAKIRGKNKTNNSRPLRRKEVHKLHHFWGHIHPEKLKGIVKRSGKWNEETMRAIEELKNCEPCKVENKRPPKPKSTFQKSISFNHVIQIDLKENIRYKQAPNYILYIVDVFTKFKAARYIPNKRGETVTEALMLEWVKYFGPPKYIQSDRGKEFLNQHLETFCNIHGIRMTTTASYSPNSNGLVERGHATIDKMMEKMLTADSKESPAMALCWAVQAANCMELVEGISPHMLVFGRNPSHPSTSTPADMEQMNEVSQRLASQLQMMMSAREVFASLEADSTIQKALTSRIYTDPIKIQVGDWIYFKSNVNRYWNGPIKVLAKDGKRLHCLKHGSAVVVNTDDVLLHKPDEDDIDPQKFISLQAADQQPEPNMGETQQSGRDLGVPGSAPEQTDPSQVQSPDIVEIQQRENDDRNGSDVIEVPANPSVPVENLVSSQNKSSTARLEAIGNPVTCTMCEEEISSKDAARHLNQDHNISRPNIRTLTRMTDSAPDSLYQNTDKLAQGDVMVTKKGKYVVLDQELDDMSWQAKDFITEERLQLDLIRDMAQMRYIGPVNSSNDEGFSVTSEDGSQVFYSHQDFTKKIFIAAEHEESLPESQRTFVVNIPRNRHSEPECVAAKVKELGDFDHFDVYETVDQPDDNIIGTEWVLVEKDLADGTKKIKARLCMRGDCETNKHMIPTNSPTANKVTIKILLALAASNNMDVSISDVRRAFLQTEDLKRDVFVRPPAEARVPHGKVWRLKRACYGLIDASRAYFLRYAGELKSLGFQPLEFDPATFVLREQGVTKAVCATHVDDCMAVGDTDTLAKTQQQMETRLSYGDVQKLPARFLGINISKSENGDIVLDQDHYLKEIEIPDLEKIKRLAKQDVLPDKFQSEFRSAASKINMLALTSRPDFAFAAKHLTSRYGKATKSDFTQAAKLLKKAKEESSKMLIPNIGAMEDWTLVAVSDASNKSASNMFSVGGYVIMLVNKKTNAAAVLTWSSKKIERVVTSSLAAETLALEKMMSKVFLVRRLLEGIMGSEANTVPCIALVDSQNLWSCVHNISACSDDRLQADIINIRQSIHDDKSVNEVRYIHNSEMIADSLTKQTNLTGNMLLSVVRSGYYDLPGGHKLRDSTMVSAKTWSQLMQAESQTQEQQQDRAGSK